MLKERACSSLWGLAKPRHNFSETFTTLNRPVVSFTPTILPPDPGTGPSWFTGPLRQKNTANKSLTGGPR